MTCATCSLPLCDHTDAAWSRTSYSPNSGVDRAGDPETAGMRESVNVCGEVASATDIQTNIGNSAPYLTPDDIRVIRDRHYGWESASPALLAKVFRVSHQRISAVLRAYPGVSQERRA